MATKDNEKLQPQELVMVSEVYESLRYNGCDLENAIGEFVDNSIEANATQIAITTHQEKVKHPDKKKPVTEVTEIAVADDGDGMPVPVLGKCLVMGQSMRDASPEGRHIGRFGLGMKLGAISVAREVWVYSKTADEDRFYATHIDLDEISENTMVSIPVPKATSLPENYKDFFKKSKHGTLVVLRKCDRVGSDAKLGSYLGRTFRKFIEDDGLKVTLNDGQVFVQDPLYLSRMTKIDRDNLIEGRNPEEKATVFGTSTITVDVPGKPGETADVKITMTLLPESWRPTQGSGGSEFAKLHKIPDNEGISICREGREVLYGKVPYLFGKRGQAKYLELDRWWGMEICFPACLDPYFEVKFIKRGAEPVESMRERLRQTVHKSVEAVRKEIRNGWKRSEEASRSQYGNYSKAEGAMSQASKKLPTKQMTPEEEDKILDRAARGAVNDRPPRNDAERRQQEEETEKLKKQLKEKPYSIVPVEWPSDCLFEAEHHLDKLTLCINEDHPFTQAIRVRLSQSDESADSKEAEDAANRVIDDMVALLLTAYAKAEALTCDYYGDDVDADLLDAVFNHLRSEWGTILGTFVKKYGYGDHDE